MTTTLLVIDTFRLPPDQLVAARPVMRRMIDASRAEPGCLDYGYAEDVLDPGLVHVTERWVDQAALDRHFASPHIAQWRGTWPSLGIGERRLSIYEVGEARAT